MLKRRLNAGALNLAILLSIITASLALLLFSWRNNQNQLVNLANVHWQLHRNCLSAYNLVSVEPELYTYAKRTIDLFDTGKDTVVIHTRPVGAFFQSSIAAQRNSLKYELNVIYGTIQRNMPVFWTLDGKLPISLAGNTRIDGPAYVPQIGTKEVFIEGHAYTGSKHVNGMIKYGDKIIPEIDDGLINYIKDRLKGNLLINDSDVVNSENKIIHEWSKATIVLNLNSSYIPYDTLIGNIVIYNPDSLIVGCSSFLQDVTLISPVIKIEVNKCLQEDTVFIKDSVKTARVHLIASDTIVIGKNVHLEYPSSVILLQDKKIDEKQSLIYLAANSKVDGVVLFIDNAIKRSITANVVVEKAAIVNGQIIVLGNLDMKGIVIGHVFAKRFVLHTAAAIYENHLLNASILANKMEGNVAGIHLKHPMLYDVTNEHKDGLNYKYPAIWLSYPQKH